MKHRARVYETPPGFLTADERLVLLVLADETPDFHEGSDGNPDFERRRLEWAHDREKLMTLLGLDPDSDADKKWLARRLKALDDAGFITRRKQRRREGGVWGRPSIKLEVSAFEFEIFDGIIVKPTERAAKGDPRAKNLDRNTKRDDAGRFATDLPPGDIPEGTVKDTPEGAVLDTPEGDRGTLPRDPNWTEQDLEQDLKQDSRRPPAVEVDDDINLNHRKQKAIADLTEWSSSLVDARITEGGDASEFDGGDT